MPREDLRRTLARVYLKLDEEMLDFSVNQVREYADMTNSQAIKDDIKKEVTRGWLAEHNHGKRFRYSVTPKGRVGFRSAMDAINVAGETAGDNISILIDRFGPNWKGRYPLEEEYQKHPRWFLKARVPWLVSDCFYYNGCNRKGSQEVFPGTKDPLDGWIITQSSGIERERYLTVEIEELLLVAVSN